MEELVLCIDYDLIGDEYWIGGNIKREAISEILEAYLSTQTGKGIDSTKANEVDLYSIDIGLDLSDDSFSIGHNCGNKGLRDGILMTLLGRLAT